MTTQPTEHQDSRTQDSRKQESRRQKTDLDNRYGKIGISAVAGAVCHHGEQQERAKEKSRKVPYDRD
jgi:hypothetical protein